MTDVATLNWHRPTPFSVTWTILDEHIDHYQHTNNGAYVNQLERVAWAHSNHLGLSMDDYRALDRGMAIKRHEIDYLGATHLDDVLHCATWIVQCDRKLVLSRAFQFIRESDGLTVLEAKTDFVCIALSSGKPKRMPSLFSEVYGNAMVTE